MEDIRQFLLRHGVLAPVGASNLRIQPPLIVTEAQVREGLAIVDEALSLADRLVD
jgi:4-aminobutyrate aminotransferase-like enzyme